MPSSSTDTLATQSNTTAIPSHASTDPCVPISTANSTATHDYISIPGDIPPQVPMSHNLNMNNRNTAPPSYNLHPMQIISKSDIFKKKLYLANVTSCQDEPTSFTQASKLSVWKQAMSEEFCTLLNQHI